MDGRTAEPVGDSDPHGLPARTALLRELLCERYLRPPFWPPPPERMPGTFAQRRRILLGKDLRNG